MKNYLDRLSPEIREELEKSEKQRQELYKCFNEKLKANAHHEKAVEILKKAIQSAVDDPAMTQEIKDIADGFIALIEGREFFQYDYYGFFKPLIELERKEGKSESGRNAALSRHAENYELHDKIKGIWASGKYSDRDKCAEDEYSALGFGSFKAARNSLKNSPDPSPWPAKKTKK